MWVNKVKIRAIVDTGAPINIISTRFAKRLGIALDLDHCKEFGTAGTQSTTAQGAYSALPLCFGLLSVAAPAIVLPNQNYNFLIGTAFMKQFNVTICHKNHLFTIFGQNIPLHYSAKSDGPSTKTVNLVYADGVIPVPYSLLSRTYRGSPSQIFENKGFPLKSLSCFSLPPGVQKISDVGIAFDIPRDLYGHIVSPCQALRHEPLVAPGLILPTGLQSIHLLIANPYAYPLQIRKKQTIGFIHFMPLSDIQDILPFGNFSEMDLPASVPGVFPILWRKDVVNLLEDQFIEASKLFE